MTEGLPIYASKFASFRVVEAKFRFEDREKISLLENRIDAVGNEHYFTIIENRSFHASSVPDLLFDIPAISAIEISHSIYFSLDEKIVQGELTEVFTPYIASDSEKSVHIRLQLSLDNREFETEDCETLMDAIWEIQEQFGAEELWLRTCFHCKFSGHALDYQVGDREYWCYRDVPEAFEDLQINRKTAHNSSKFAGSYSANAFHSCAAWQLLDSNLPRNAI